MAIFHQQVKILSRSGARGCVAASAYQSGEKLLDRRTGEMKSYSKDEVGAKGILSPDGSPSWVENREELWNRVEEFEDRIICQKFDSSLKTGEAKLKTDAFREKRLASCQLAQTMVCALPKELTLEQNIELVEMYLKERFVSKGFIVDYAIHMDSGNPHVHCMVPLRAVDGDTFAVKKETSYRRQEGGVRNLFDRGGIKEGRLLWAQITNRCLEKAGFDERVDARSYREQGIDLIPTQHRGYNADKIEREGGRSRIVQENREIMLKNVKILLDNPGLILKRVALSRVVFTKVDVEREIFKIVGGDPAAYQALKYKVEGMSIPSVFSLVSNENRINSAEFLEENCNLARDLSEDLDRNLTGDYAGKILDDAIELKHGKLKTREVSGSELSFEKDSFDQEGIVSNVVAFSRQTVKSMKSAFLGSSLGASLGFSIRERAVSLGVLTKHGEKLYTTQSLKEKEDRIVGLVDTLHDKAFLGKPSIFHRLKETFVPPQSVETVLGEMEERQGFRYSLEQRNVIENLIQPSQIQVLSGRAGTGKSTVLRGIADVYSKAGYKVMGTAFQGKIAESLSRDLGCPSYTLSKLVNSWDYVDSLGVTLTPQIVAAFAKYQFTSRHVVILDEGSMVSDTLWEKLLERIQKSGAKLIVVQDQAQIKTLYGLDIARYVEEKVGSIQLSEVVRQQVSWQKEASTLLNDHRVSSGLALYDQHHRISFGKNDQKEVLVQDFLKEFKESSPYDLAVGALFNKDVDDLNNRVLSKLLEKGMDSFVVTREKEKLGGIDVFTQTFAVGARIMFTQNDANERFVKTHFEKSFERNEGKNKSSIFKKDKRGVRNGTLGVIESYNANEVTVSLQDGRLVRFKLKDYSHIALSYALTINKLQGSTFEKTFNLYNRSMDASKLLVMMTRHRVDTHLYAAGVSDIHQIARSGGDRKDLIRDYTPEQKVFKDKVLAYRETTLKIGEALAIKRDLETEQGRLSQDHPLIKELQVLTDTRKEYALEILRDLKDTRLYVMQEGLTIETIEVHAGVRERTLSRFEVEAVDRVEAYFKVSFEARMLYRKSNNGNNLGIFSDEPSNSLNLLRQERNSLAFEILENKELHRRFLRMETVIDGKKTYYKTFRGVIYPSRLGSIKAIEQQALRHAQNLKKQDPEQQKFLDLIESFRENMGIVGRGYHQLKAINKDIMDQGGLVQGVSTQGVSTHGVSTQRVSTQDNRTNDNVQKALDLSQFIEKGRAQRDHLALCVIRGMEVNEWAYGLLRETMGDGWWSFNKKLIQYAYLGKLRESIDRYEAALDTQVKIQEKVRIGQLVFGEGKSFKRDRYAVFKERGLCSKDFKSFEKSFENPHGSPHGNKYWNPDGKLFGHEAKIGSSLANQNKRLVLSKTPDYREIRDRLSVDAEGYGRYLLGLETGRSGKELIWKSAERKISLNRLNGQWQDFKTGEKGDLIALTMYVNGGDKKEAYAHAMGYLGLGSHFDSHFESHFDPKDERKNIQNRKEDLIKENEQRKSQSIEKVNTLLNMSQPIEGTLAETYLRKHRGIKTTRLSSDLRFIGKNLNKSFDNKHPALLSLARDKEGTVTGCQVTYLDPKTGAKAQDIKIPKRSYGKISHSFVMIQHGAQHGGQAESQSDHILYIAEGVETALSLKEAGVKGIIVAGLGLHNLGKADHLIKESVVLVADNDGEGHPTRLQIQKIEQRYKELYKDRDVNVQVIMPEEVGTDFNDTLKDKGVDEVRRGLDRGIEKSLKSEDNSTPEEKSKYGKNDRNKSRIKDSKIETPETINSPVRDSRVSDSRIGDSRVDDSKAENKRNKKDVKTSSVEPQMASGKQCLEAGKTVSDKARSFRKDLESSDVKEYETLIQEGYLRVYGSIYTKQDEIKTILASVIHDHQIFKTLGQADSSSDKNYVIARVLYEYQRAESMKNDLLGHEDSHSWVKEHKSIDRLVSIEGRLFKEGGFKKDKGIERNTKEILKANNNLMEKEIKGLLDKGMNKGQAELYTEMKMAFQERYGVLVPEHYSESLKKMAGEGVVTFRERYKKVMAAISGKAISKENVAVTSSYYYAYKEYFFKAGQLIKTGKIPSQNQIDLHMKDVGMTYRHHKNIQTTKNIQNKIRHHQKDRGGIEM